MPVPADRSFIVTGNFLDVAKAVYILRAQKQYTTKVDSAYLTDGDSAQALQEIHADLRVYDTVPSDVTPVAAKDILTRYGRPFRRLDSSPLSKQLLDAIGAPILLLALSPLFLILMILVRRDGGPAFYGQVRVGHNGQPFKCWKFRSMVPGAAAMLQDILANDPAARAEWSRDFKLKNDPRITRIGNFLRRTSLDELPQLWNVLRGDMSLVGPRPIVEAEKIYYGDHFADYASARPGVTGLWQVSGRNDVTYARRVFLDMWYANYWSFGLDLYILFQTIAVVIFRRGSY